MEKIMVNLVVPTGNICVMQGDYGLLEFISVGDYGKEKNVKADFLGITREINGVPNGEIMPLSEKWVVTVSTQYGCAMGCKFCDAPKIKYGGNVSANDLAHQIKEALSLHPEITATKRLNIHYARMGEPTFNPQVLENAKMLHKIVKPHIGSSMIHPVLSTMLPNRNQYLVEYLNEWCDIKNEDYRGDAGLQFSINSTEDWQREDMFNGMSLSLEEISEIGQWLPMPKGRKYALNFALADDYIVDAHKLSNLFDNDKFMVKITPLHRTKSCEQNNIKTTGGYENFTPYRKVEKELKSFGFDVIVFVPSYEEDLGLITCGNAILSGSMPTVPFTRKDKGEE